MSAGTLTLTNGSPVVAGAGTAFTTELAARDFMVATIGGITYTLPVQSVDSDTQITLISNFPGPTQTGSAWSAIPWQTQQRITAELVSQTTEALRGQNYDKRNWQAVFSDSGDITVMLPDGSTFTGPSWQKIAKLATDSDFESIKPLAEQIRRDAQQVEADKAASAASAASAVTSEDNAAKSKQNAARSETNAASSATGAADHEALARKYAVSPEDAEVVAGEFSARHYAAKAQKSAEESAAHNPGESLSISKNLSDLADRAAAWLNVRPVGSTPLAGDPVGQYDATTRRWVENLVGAGITGPTMNGVMNYGVGKPLLNTSRAQIPTYELPLDGQLVKRADWPELWAYAQREGAISDADWINTRTARGQYSTGDGSTSFRLPDWNGKRRKGDSIDGIPFTGEDSIHALFVRGDGVDASDNAGTAPGTVRPSAAPNIKGTFDSDNSGRAWINWSNPTGAFNKSNVIENTFQPVSGYVTVAGFATSNFDASRSNAAYGRDATPEVRPNAVMAVWCVRASGGFTAANTVWSVTNSDAVLPATGVSTAGGEVISEYKNGKTRLHAASLTSGFKVGDSLSYGRIRVEYNGVYKDFTLNADGDFTAPRNIIASGASFSSDIYVSRVYSRLKGGAAIFKDATTADASANAANLITSVANPGCRWDAYVYTNPGQYYAIIDRLSFDGRDIIWQYTSSGQTWTPLGQVAIQGSDVRNEMNAPHSLNAELHDG